MKNPVLKHVILLLNLLLVAYAHAQTPVSINGLLKVVGTKLVNKNGYPIQLRGMSTHGIQWYESCTKDASLDTLSHDWGADILRVSMYIQEGGYETNPSYYTSLVKDLVNKVTARGLYALIDFHMLTPGDPNYNTSRAITFFTDIANTYKNNNNVLYEICNEPNGVSWAGIKNYADQIIPVIRAIDNDAIICVGTRGWSSLGLSEGSSSQEIIDNPLNYPNIMYSFHFYAKSHQDYYINHLDWASDRLPIFVTEFGTQEASGDGPNDLVMGLRYLNLLRSKKISWTNWNYSDNPLSGGVWNSGTCSGNTWSTDKLKEAGVFIRNNMRTADDFGPVSGSNLALGKTVTVSSTEASTLPGTNAVDGNSSTRWSSAMYVDPQWITVDLGSNYNISQIKINWEAAYAKNFLVQISADNANWITLKDVQNNTTLSNDFTSLSGSGRYVRIYGTARGTTYGYSIYELEVYGTLVSTPNIALNKSVTVSSVEEAGLEGNYAVDGNTSTRWSSTMYTDPQWIRIDLGSNYNISQVKITWEPAYAKDYLLQVSTDNTNWTTVKTIQGNTSLTNDHTGLSATGRYVRMYGTARGSDYGYSIYELEVYGSAIQSTVALAKTFKEQLITVYPIPAHDQVLITIPCGNQQKSQISLCDINGKVYFSGSTTGNTYNMNVSKLPAGIYIVQIISGNKRTTKKIVKE